MQQYLAALDQGTTSTRCILFDHDGRACVTAQREIAQFYPHPGWVEQDPLEIWTATLAVLRQAMTQAGIEAGQLAGIGITNQRDTTLVWERATGKPVYNAIVWQCRRTAERIETLTPAQAESIRQKTGLIPDAYFSASKAEWILRHVPGAADQARRGELLFGTVDSWLLWNLTGGTLHATDETNASRTMLFDIHRRCWDEELLALFGLPAAMLPRVLPSSHLYGHTAPDLLGAPVPLAGVAGDQQAALFGQCCWEAGAAKNTYGTGCFLLMHTGGRAITSRHGLLTTLAASDDTGGGYALEGSVFVAGAAIQWLRDELHILETAGQSERYCHECPDTGGVYLVPAFAGLGAPYWQPEARGMLVGLTRGSSRAVLVRATVESMAYQVRDVLEAMQQDAGLALQTLRVDGGASANNFLLQFQADLLGADLIRPTCIETTALGAAYLAGLAVGFWADRAELARIWQANCRFVSRITPAARAQRLAGWRRAVDSALYWARWQAPAEQEVSDANDRL